MPTVIAKKALTFSLVSINVGIVSATGEHRVPLHKVHATDGGRIRQRRVCEYDGQEVPPDQIARGYQAPDGRTVVLTPDELDQLPLPTTREIHVLGFMPAESLDPTACDKPYYLGPTTAAAARPYALLRQALLDTGQVAVVRTALHTREALAVLRVRENALVLHTLLWPDELRSPEGIAPADIELQEKELSLARTLMDTISEYLHLESEHDDYAQALEDVVAAKLRGAEPPRAVGALPPAPGTAVDFMAALERALADAEQRHPKTAARAVKNTAAKKTTTRRSATSKALPAAGKLSPAAEEAKKPASRRRPG
ncbi:Ku protein (plasmid) [Streptomyces viridifaciens]|nr:Ku protein [Streptomyces viridifaciens]